MKKKLTVNTIALSSIRTRKKQYLLMIIGIIFAMVFSSSILFFASSLVSSSKEMARNSVGDSDAVILNADQSFIEDAKNDKFLDSYGLGHIIGFGQTEACEENQGTAIAYLDDQAKELSYITFIEGRYPEKEGEIALEKSTLARLRMTDAKVGDTITLDFYNQNGTELATESVKKTFTIVGIASNKLTNIISYHSEPQKYYKLIPSAFVYQGADTDVGGKENLCCYVIYNEDFRYGGQKYYYESQEAYMTDKGYYDKGMSDINIYKDNFTTIQGDAYTKILLASVLVVVLLFASAMGIINAFNANLKDRKKQIGLLRTVGATKRQIIHIYGREAFIISLVCAPVSVAVSFFVVKFSVRLLGEEFIFVPNILVLILSLIVSLIFVMLAACIPLLSASRISPMQSIRNIELTRKMKNKKIKSKKSFDTPSLLAKRSLVFHRGKSAVVSLLLIITIVLSSYGFSFFAYVDDDYTERNYDYQASDYSGDIYSNLFNNESMAGFSENQRRDILISPYVQSVMGFKEGNVIVNRDKLDNYEKLIAHNSWDVFESHYYSDEGIAATVTKDNFEEVFMGEYSENYLSYKQHYSIDKEFYSLDLNAYDSSVLQQLKNSVIDGEINVDKINSGQEVILIAPPKLGYVFKAEDNGYMSELHSNERYDDKKNDYYLKGECPYKAGDMLDLSVVTARLRDSEEYGLDFLDKKDCKVRIGAVLSEVPRELARSYDIYGGDVFLLTSTNGFESFMTDTKYKSFKIYLKTECNDEIDAEMMTLLRNVCDASSADSYIYSAYGMQKESDQTKSALLISLIAIIILFLSISASIINNSFSAQIREGKREIGTLRAVGASQREIVMSYIKQLVSIFGLSYGIGFAFFGISYGVFTFVSYMNAKTFGYEFTGLELKITLWQTVLACLVVLAVCSINLMVRIRKEMKNSIISNIREL